MVMVLSENHPTMRHLNEDNDQLEPSAPCELTGHETHALLKVIIDELRNIGNSLARQDERIEELRRTKTGKISTDGNREDSMSITPPVSYDPLNVALCLRH